MNRERVLNRVKKIIANKPFRKFKLPDALTSDKQAYIELCKFIFNRSTPWRDDYLKKLTDSVDEDIFKDKDIVSQTYDILGRSYDGISSLEKIYSVMSKEAGLALVKKQPLLIGKFNDEMKDDEDIARTAIVLNNGAFNYVSERLKDDFDLAKIVVRKDGYMLNNISTRLKDDRDMVRLAVSENPYAIQYASDRLRDDSEMGRFVVSKKASAFKYLSKRLRDDKDIALVAVEDTEAEAVAYASDRLKNDLDVGLVSVRANGKTLQYLSMENRSNHRIVSEAIKQSPEYIEYASRRYIYSDKLLFKAVIENNEVLEYIPEEMSKVMVDMLDKYNSANKISRNDDREIDY